MFFGGATGQTHDGSPRILIPIGRAHARKGRNDIDAVGIFHRAAVFFALRAIFEKTHLVAEPLNGGARDKNASFERILHFVVGPCRDRGQKPFLRKHDIPPGIHEHKAACPVGVFYLARVKAALSEQRRLLISRITRDRDTTAKAIGRSVEMPRRIDFRQHRARDTEIGKNLFVPIELVNVKEHGAARVGVVGRVDSAVGQIPDEPGVHRAEAQFSAFGARSGTRNGIEDPGDLACRKIGVRNKPRRLANVVGPAFLFHLFDAVGSPAALPDDGVVNRFAGRGFPNNGRLALVGDTDGGDLLGARVHLLHGFHGHAHLRGPDVHGVVFDPARLRIVLFKLALHDTRNLPFSVKQNGARAGGTLIHGDDVAFCFHHGLLFKCSRVLFHYSRILRKKQERARFFAKIS